MQRIFSKIIAIVVLTGKSLACKYGMEFSIAYKTIFMKGSRAQNNRQNKQLTGHRPRPDVRDDLDSRSNEEQDNKGDDVTHNRKDVRNNGQRRKNEKP